jgi:hypothetical protein
MKTMEILLDRLQKATDSIIDTLKNISIQNEQSNQFGKVIYFPILINIALSVSNTSTKECSGIKARAMDSDPDGEVFVFFAKNIFLKFSLGMVLNTNPSMS